MKGTKEVIELVLIVALIVSCHATRKTTNEVQTTDKPNTSIDLPSFDKEAHRGGRGLMPENTIPAMLHAIDLGVNTLEMDAVITKDGQVILSHEPFFSAAIATKPDGTRVTPQEERSLNIFQMTYAETQRYDVGLAVNPGFKDQQKLAATKPLLSKVIDSVEAYTKKKKSTPVFYNIETKTNPRTDNQYHPAPEEFVEKLMAVILQKHIEDRVIIQSFDFRTLQILHTKYPAIRTAALVADNKGLEEHLKQLQFIPTIYSPLYTLVKPELVTQCHQQKIKVLPWTVNDKPTIEKLKALGVDGIISDYPNLF
ncbi:glycerophosphodiester phosphodiesterase [Paraflavitalea soli]|uniref:Glycerophosphodiester phosphodiesterase n=1 Tax=Paraflavitalea soli TaxID=2315862 RepID=A0A3B7MVH4_9BACT|nr:glycerophosphodiester phosphodiesterase [Paraflavitalea soli]AXY78098.1 glycerophosphodiester phosphodiesterase [Paraflavitalea soli]